MPAISLPIVASASQSPSTRFTALGSPGPSFASFLAGTGIPQGKGDTNPRQEDSPLNPPAINDLSITANPNPSVMANQPVIANQNLRTLNAEPTKTGAPSSSPVNLEAPTAELNKADALNPDLAKIEISSATSVITDKSASGLSGKIAATPATPRKKEITEPSSAALAVAALALPQWTPTVPPQTPATAVSISAGAPASISDAKVSAVLPHPQIARWARLDLTAFAQRDGAPAQSPISSPHFDTRSINQTAITAQSLNSNTQVGSEEQPRPPSGRDSTPQAPAITNAPQDGPLTLPLADPAKPPETFPVNEATNILANLDTQTYPQSSVSDFQPPPAKDSSTPAVNPEPHTTNSPAARLVFPETKVAAESGLPPELSTSEATSAGQIAPAGAKPLSSEIKAQAAARAAVNFNSPIQIPGVRPALTHTQGRAPIQPSTPAPGSNPRTSLAPHAEISDSKGSPGLPTSSLLKTGNTKTESTSPVQSANQNPQPEQSAAHTSYPKADTSKTNAPPKAAGDINSGETQSSSAESKTTSPLPIAATMAAATQANSQLDSAAANAGPLIAGVQNAANSSVRTDGAAPQVKTEATLDNTPGPEPAQVPVSRIFHNPSQSEMHVGFRTESFGAVEVHTTISEKQVEVALGSERGDLKGFMASELPALQSNLQQHDLRLQSLRTIAPAYMAQSDSFSGTGGQPQHQQRQSHGNQPVFFQQSENRQAEVEDLVAPDVGLSVRI